MGLYLCILDQDDEETAGFEVGHYSDFGAYRDAISRHIPETSRRFPVLMQHSNCDGEWNVEELPRLEAELIEIGRRFRSLPPVEPSGAFEHNPIPSWSRIALRLLPQRR